jgi:uncharacterized protein (DUF849 family)
MDGKAIITCAVTGSIHTPSMSPYLPYTVEDIAAQAIEAAEAGAAIIHLHVRDPSDGRPSADGTLFRKCIELIRFKTDAVINVSTGGSSAMTLDERLSGPRALAPEMCSLNMGSMNFGIFPMAHKEREWKYEWELRLLRNSHAGLFKNTFADIEQIIEQFGQGCGSRFEFECYDVGHLYTLAHYLDEKRVRPPLFVQTVFGILGGIGADVENVLHMRQIANKLFGNDYEWSVLGAGRSQMRLAALGASLGSHVRVGLEDSLWIRRGELARSNAEQVRMVRNLLALQDIQPADPGEARALLGIAP